MVDRPAKLLDVVALLRDAPEFGLVRGQVGAVVDDAGGDAVLVEFADSEGVAIATPNLKRADLLVLNYDNVAAE